ncbi:MAG: enoyl-CoA hydratase [Crocinitomicaceae bacterium]|nr:enoyl-CoA hydratase [Crocinitomicaceae bacterium]
MNYFEENIVQNISNQEWAFIECNIVNNILSITLNRPAKKNALHPQMVNEIAFALSHAHHNNEIRVILFKANGEVFCSGADLKAFMGISEEFQSSIPQPSKNILLGEIFNEVYKPIICQLHGNIMAGGLFFLAGSHFTIASENVKLGLPEVKRGLFPFQVLAALLNNISKQNAINWCIKGDEISAKTAKEWGLISEITEVENLSNVTKKLIEKIVNNSPNAIRMGLKAFEKITKNAGEHQYLMEMLQKTIMSEDAQEGIKAFKEKRKPVWTGK